MNAHSKYRLHHSIGYHLSLAARLQERRLDGWMRPMGLTRTTWCILLAVANENLTRPSEIAEFVGIDRTATSRALRQMEEIGHHVEAIPAPFDADQMWESWITLRSFSVAAISLSLLSGS